MREGALWLAKARSKSRLNGRKLVEVFPLFNVVLDLLCVLVLFMHLARVKHRLPKAQQELKEHKHISTLARREYWFTMRRMIF